MGDNRADRTVSLHHKVLKDYTFSDGTQLKAGSYTCTPSTALLHSSTLYPNPTQFDVYRFFNLRQQPGGEGMYQFCSSSDNYFGFGLGAHICPGRFLASHELKLVLVALLRGYDLRFGEEEVRRWEGRGRPKNHTFEDHIAPDGKARVEFRRRKVVR